MRPCGTFQDMKEAIESPNALGSLLTVAARAVKAAIDLQLYCVQKVATLGYMPGVC
jgi:hypothetical protein